MKCYVSGEETLRASNLLSLEDYKKKFGKSITLAAKEAAAEDLGFIYSKNIRYFNDKGNNYGFVDNYYFTGKLINEVKKSVGLFEIKDTSGKLKIKSVIKQGSSEYKNWCSTFNLKLIEMTEAEYKQYCERHKHIDFLCSVVEKVQPEIKIAIHRLLACLLFNLDFIEEWRLDYQGNELNALYDRGFPHPWISPENVALIADFNKKVESCWNNKKKVSEAAKAFSDLIANFHFTK